MSFRLSLPFAMHKYFVDPRGADNEDISYEAEPQPTLQSLLSR